MTFTKRQEEAARAIVGLPEDDWQPMDRVTFEAAQAVLADEIARIDRQAGRRAEARREPVLSDGRASKIAPRYRKPAGSKRRAHDAEWERNRPLVVERSGGFCEASVPGCATYGVHVHHKAGRVGPHAHDLGNLLHVCEPCHSWIHAHPAESYGLGLLVKRLGPVTG